jgi:hypothetical protein
MTANEPHHSDWEVCLLWHDEKHEKKLSIPKNEEFRYTYCPQCREAVLFTRKYRK